MEELDQREQSAGIGFVQQDPENQIVTDKVWHELAFGLESLGYDTPTIRRRVAEMASFFGIQTWFYKNVTELSGGQKQLLNLASIMAMQPSVLILDEPTSQLDPIAAADFLATLGKINRELGTTVVLTEHRLEDAFPLASRVAVMDRGRLLCTGSPAEVGAILRGQITGRQQSTVNIQKNQFLLHGFLILSLPVHGKSADQQAHGQDRQQYQQNGAVGLFLLLSGPGTAVPAAALLPVLGSAAGTAAARVLLCAAAAGSTAESPLFLPARSALAGLCRARGFLFRGCRRNGLFGPAAAQIILSQPVILAQLTGAQGRACIAFFQCFHGLVEEDRRLRSRRAVRSMGRFIAGSAHRVAGPAGSSGRLWRSGACGAARPRPPG